MTHSTWHWAALSDAQLQMLAEAERTLGAGYLLAYQSGQTGGAAVRDDGSGGLRPAPLDDTQVECLQGLEGKLGATVIAYDRGG